MTAAFLKSTPDAEITMPPPCRVMHVTWSLVAGGAEVYALSILRHLNPARFAGEICAIDQGGALEPEFKHLDIPYSVMNRRPGIEWSLFWRLYRLFRKHRIDVVHTHHFNQIFYSALAARLAGCRLVHTEHSVEVFDRRRRRVAYRLLTKLCDKVVAVGDDVHRFLFEKVGVSSRKLQTLFAGVEIPRTLRSRAEVRAALEFDARAPLILIVARLYPEKNHLLLISALKLILREIHNTQLLIVGGGIQEDVIRSEIDALGLGSNVQMLGVRRDVSDLLAAADVIALASDREGLPLIVLEAMAAARPVVATRVGELGSVITDGLNGRLVPPRDAVALAKGLMELLRDPQLAAGMGERGRQIAIERFAIRPMIDAHEALYSSSKP